MRRPFYRRSHKAWYVKDTAGRFIRLGRDESEAHRIYEDWVKRQPKRRERPVIHRVPDLGVPDDSRPSATTTVCRLRAVEQKPEQSQRAMIAAKMANLKNGQKKSDEAVSNDTAIADAAKLLDVSRRSVIAAKHVLDHGSKDLVELIEPPPPLSPEEQCVESFGEARQRLNTLRQIFDTLYPFERRVVRTWLDAEREVLSCDAVPLDRPSLAEPITPSPPAAAPPQCPYCSGPTVQRAKAIDLPTPAGEARRRERQLRHALILIRLLSPLRFGATLDELHEDLQHEVGKLCKRTVSRHLHSLVAAGLVECRRSEFGKRWVWIGQPRHRPIERAAERMAGAVVG